MECAVLVPGPGEGTFSRDDNFFRVRYHTPAVDIFLFLGRVGPELEEEDPGEEEADCEDEENGEVVLFLFGRPAAVESLAGFDV